MSRGFDWYRLQPLKERIVAANRNGLLLCFLHLPEEYDPYDIFMKRVDGGRRFREDKEFLFDYLPSITGGMGVSGIIRWCNSDDYDLFQKVLEGTHPLVASLHDSKPVGVVIDATDHPLMPALLRGLGYDVKCSECINPGSVWAREE